MQIIEQLQKQLIMILILKSNKDLKLKRVIINKTLKISNSLINKVC
jgi:hypothetical protein